MNRTGSAGKDLFTFTMPMPAGVTALDSLPISVTVSYTCDGVTYTTSTGSLRLPMQGLLRRYLRHYGGGRGRGQAVCEGY